MAFGYNFYVYTAILTSFSIILAFMLTAIYLKILYGSTKQSVTSTSRINVACSKKIVLMSFVPYFCRLDLLLRKTKYESVA